MLLKSSSSGLKFSVVTAVRLLKASKPGLEVGVMAGRKVVTTGADGVGVLNVEVGMEGGRCGTLRGSSGSSSKSSSLRLGLVKNKSEALILGEGVVVEGSLEVARVTGSSNSNSSSTNGGCKMIKKILKLDLNKFNKEQMCSLL